MEKTEVPDSVEAKPCSRRTPDSSAINSVSTLINYRATLTLNRTSLPCAPEYAFHITVEPKSLQGKGLLLLHIENEKISHA